ncbi:hypothetical protein CSOJ01_03410 [Colletotrichum sojae]|uniref:Uncharacterized protein n=1 Tax=Colletotrichum sojae TaxID=2175907 RepID=A0A8H6JN71_9PEZI|nr:hypothetical protein CSOJ01_03410 [Colletotrichum sojae]
MQETQAVPVTGQSGGPTEQLIEGSVEANVRVLEAEGGHRRQRVDQWRVTASRRKSAADILLRKATLGFTKAIQHTEPYEKVFDRLEMYLVSAMSIPSMARLPPPDALNKLSQLADSFVVVTMNDGNHKTRVHSVDMRPAEHQLSNRARHLGCDGGNRRPP